MRRLVAIAVLLAGAATAAASGPAFTTTWKAPDVDVSFAGRKVAALVISADQHLRVSAEEQLVRELTGRGLQSVATYRMAPQEELTSAERARPWFERAGVDGIVALRPVSREKEIVYSPSTWTTTNYSTLWGYYGYGWTSVYDPGGTREDTTIVVETLAYSVPLDKLLWAGVSTTTNPKSAPVFIKQLIEAAIKELKKQRLVT